MRSLRALRPVTWVVVVTLIALFLPASPASAAQAGAQLTVTGGGTVRIDGAPAATGATIFPGSRIRTDAGTTAVVTSGGSRVTLNADTDAIVTYAGGYMRADVICGSASGLPAAGSTFDLITHGDTSVFVSTGGARVMAGGRTIELATNQTQTFDGGVHIVANGGSGVDASTFNCACLCAAPLPLAPIVAGGSSLLLLLLLGAGAAAAATTVIIATNGEDEGSVVLSPAVP